MGGMGGGSTPPETSATSDSDEIQTIYVNLTEEHNELASESLGGHLRGLGGATPPFQILKKKILYVER